LEGHFPLGLDSASVWDWGREGESTGPTQSAVYGLAPGLCAFVDTNRDHKRTTRMSISVAAPRKRGRPFGTFELREQPTLAKMTELVTQHSMQLMDAARQVWREANFQGATEYSVCRRLCRRWRDNWST
jgi:hypothetical protein